MTDEFKDIPMLTQPLLTEDGYINQACMNELEQALLNAPPTYKRLLNDPEWTKKDWLFIDNIPGSLAKWAIRQCDTIPPNLETVLKFTLECFKIFAKQDKESIFLSDGIMVNWSLCEINEKLHACLMDLKYFKEWNDEQKLKQWIDLDALLHNVCLDFRTERRENDRFETKFKMEQELKSNTNEKN